MDRIPRFAEVCVCAGERRPQSRGCLHGAVLLSDALRVNLVTVNDSANSFGDKQLGVDVIADDLLWDLAKTSPLVYEASSEEEPEIVERADAIAMTHGHGRRDREGHRRSLGEKYLSWKVSSTAGKSKIF